MKILKIKCSYLWFSVSFILALFVLLYATLFRLPEIAMKGYCICNKLQTFRIFLLRIWCTWHFVQPGSKRHTRSTVKWQQYWPDEVLRCLISRTIEELNEIQTILFSYRGCEVKCLQVDLLMFAITCYTQECVRTCVKMLLERKWLNFV